jgi:hypothetical protein
MKCLKWLEGELGTTDVERIGRAANTPAYGLWMLSGMSTNCVKIFETLVPAIGGDKATELYLWLKAARYLQVARHSNGKFDGAFKMQSFSIVLSAITGNVANTVIGE